MAQRDVIAIIGTTGVGKTQLALDLARSIKAREAGPTLGAEIINADSMQVYRGLDIITNKATKEERAEVKHHLMDILDPGEEYRVDHYRQDAMKAVEEISERGSLPIVVGGTMYFLQHLLFPGKLVSAQDNDEEVKPEAVTGRITKFDDLDEQQRIRVSGLAPEVQRLLFDFEKMPLVSTPTSFPPGFPVDALACSLRDPETYTTAVYQCLKAVDPVMAERWHWRDIRKVSRSLQVFLQTGHRHSSIMQEQAETLQEAQYRTLIFWPYSEPGILEPRLDARVEQMCTRGLLEEIQELRKIASKNGHHDLSKGIYQAIGYKEFGDYFRKQEAGNDDHITVPADSAQSRQALEDMKLGTRQYARRQIKWIRNKLLPVIEACKSNIASNEVYLYLLDATYPEDWSASVKGPAESILNAFMAREAMPEATSLNPIAENLLQSPLNRRLTQETPVKVPCQVCTTDVNRPFLVEEGEQMVAHRNSRAHRKRLQKRSKGRQPLNGQQKEHPKGGTS